MTAEERPHGPPFTVERYGTFGQSVIAERDWLRERVLALEQLGRNYYEDMWGGSCSDEQLEKWINEELEELRRRRAADVSDNPTGEKR
jgi:hypothetical protein